jgi:hypothetical protein
VYHHHAKPRHGKHKRPVWKKRPHHEEHEGTESARY